MQLLEEGSCPPSQPEQRMKREKKHQSFTLCEVCNIQLNSAAQAQIHYNGKSHQKRLKQLNKGKMPAAQGRSPPSRSRLPKGCPCSGTAALPGSWKSSEMLFCVLGICHLLFCPKCRASPSSSSSGFGAQEPTLQQQRDRHGWVCPGASVVCGALRFLEFWRWFEQRCPRLCPRLEQLLGAVFHLPS